MDRTERFYKIEMLLRARRIVPVAILLDELGVSRATFKRDLQYMRDRLNAPIVWDREGGGYRFAESEEGPVYELPGLWFSPAELFALITAYECLDDIDSGVLAEHIGPLRLRIKEILGVSGHSFLETIKRVRFLPMTRRSVQPRFFTEIARALLERRKIEIVAYNRARNELNTRTVSPQRLVHYRDNWYLDVWCHWRKGLRSFSVDAVRGVTQVGSPALEIPDADLDAHFASSYGIFAGEVKDWAVLRFSPMRARWVENERWHPDQTCDRLSDGGCRLSVPYSDERELLMDILRHGSEVVVEAPESLRKLVVGELEKMEGNYSRKPQV